MHAWQTLYHLPRGDSHPSSARYKGALTVIEHSPGTAPRGFVQRTGIVVPKAGTKVDEQTSALRKRNEEWTGFLCRPAAPTCAVCTTSSPRPQDRSPASTSGRINKMLKLL